MSKSPIGKLMLLGTLLAVVGGGVSTVAVVLALRALHPVAPSKPRVDMTGGTALLYDVQGLPETSRAAATDELINALWKRIDPDGAQGLVWKRIGDHRVEVQVPPLPGALAHKHDAYRQALAKATADNPLYEGVTRAIQMDNPTARAAEVDRLVARDSPLRPEVDALQAAADQFREQSAAFDKAMAAADAAQAVTRPGPLTVEQSKAAEREAARTKIAAQRTFEELQAKWRAHALNEDDLRRALRTSDARTGQHAEEFAKIVAAHPERGDALRELWTAYAAFESAPREQLSVEDVMLLLQPMGVLEFRIAANPQSVPALDAYRESLHLHGPDAGADKSWRWFKISDVSAFVYGEQYTKLALEHPIETFEGTGLVADMYGGTIYLLVANTPDRAMTHDNGTDWTIKDILRSQDQQGFPAVSFAFDAAGSQRMQALSSQNIKEPMAIILDGHVMSAPTIQNRIGGGAIQITVHQNANGLRETDTLLRTMLAGSIRGRLSGPITITTIGGPASTSAANPLARETSTQKERQD